MNIGIDIDGVLCSEDFFQLTYGIKYCTEKAINIPAISPFQPETKEIFGWSSEENLLFWKEYYLHYLTTSEFIYPDSTKIIQKWYENGHKIFIISNRKQSVLNKLGISQNMEQLSENWLRENKIPFHQLILTDGSKESFIQEKNISLMIDDNPQLLISLSLYMTVIGFRSHCNSQYLLANIPVVSTWKELEHEFNRLTILKEK